MSEMRTDTDYQWKKIQIKDFVKQLPRFMSSEVYEVNQNGDVRKYNPLSRNPVYVPVKLTEGTLSFVAGWAHSVVIRLTLPVEKIVTKYWPEKK